MRRQQRPRAPAQRRRDVPARAATVLAVVTHVGRVAQAPVPGRQVSADCAGNARFHVFSGPAGMALCAAWPFTHAAPPHGERTAVMTPGDPDEAEKLWPTPLIEGRVMA